MANNRSVIEILGYEHWEALKARGAIMVSFGEKVSGGKPTGRKAIVIGVPEKLPLNQLRKQDLIPAELQGMETDVVEFHQVNLLPKVQAADPYRTKMHRPAFGGISIGHPEITAGTLGCLVWKDGKAYALTNWHVGNMNEGKIGDPMLQPGPYDGGTIHDNYYGTIALKPPVVISSGNGPTPPAPPSDCPWFGSIVSVGNLIGWAVRSRTRLIAVRPQDQAVNLVDMCLVGPLTEAKLTSFIYEIGNVDTRNWCELEVGDEVHKSGRTSGVSVGTVQSLGASVRVGLGGNQFADFHDQIVFSNISEGGDSGSAILRRRDEFIGSHLFAGSDTNTIGNRWKNVKEIGGLD